MVAQDSNDSGPCLLCSEATLLFTFHPLLRLQPESLDWNIGSPEQLSVTWSRSVDLSEPWFSHLDNGCDLAPASQGCSELVGAQQAEKACSHPPVSHWPQGPHRDPREVSPAAKGASWLSESGALVPALLPTCSVTLARSLAQSGLQAVTLPGADCPSGDPGRQTSGGPPQLPGLFLPGLWASQSEPGPMRGSPKVMQ